MDKYRPCPSIIAIFTSDSQHPPRSKHAVYLGDITFDDHDMTLFTEKQRRHMIHTIEFLCDSRKLSVIYRYTRQVH